MLEVSSLVVRYGKARLLDEVSIALAAGEAGALLGPSGAGKSVMLRALVGLLPPGMAAEGRVTLAGASFEVGERRALAGLRGRGLALLPQSAASSLDPVRRVESQLVEVGRRWGDRRTVTEALEEVGLEPRIARAYPHMLSGGEAQRVALALALACSPRVLLADEPTASLDSPTQAEVIAALRGRCEARGIGLVLVTHDLALAAGVCARAWVIDAGRIVEEGTMLELLAGSRSATGRVMVRAARRAAGAVGAGGGFGGVSAEGEG